MTKRTITQGTAVLTLTIALAGFGVSRPTPAASGQAGEEKSFTGTISDSMCDATHMAKNKTPAECTRVCVKDGQKYALVAGDKVYTLEGHEAELNKLAGQKVRVKGSLKGETVTVESVNPAK